MKIAKVLIDKYWKGVLSLVEEKWMKEHYVEKEEKTPETAYFRYLHEKSTEGIDDPEFDQAIMAAIKGTKTQKNNWISRMNWRIAAAIILLVAASITFQYGVFEDASPQNEVETVDTYQDPEKALEETKKALLFISTQLNKGSLYTTEFSKFSESQEKLKQE